MQNDVNRFVVGCQSYAFTACIYQYKTEHLDCLSDKPFNHVTLLYSSRAKQKIHIYLLLRNTFYQKKNLSNGFIINKKKICTIILLILGVIQK